MRNYRKITLFSPDFTFADLLSEDGVKIKYGRRPKYVKATLMYSSEGVWKNFDKDLPGFPGSITYTMNTSDLNNLIIKAETTGDVLELNLRAIIDVWY